jgi:flavorubredoxin
MRVFIDTLVEHNFQNRTIGLIENGSWAPTAAKVMKTMLEKCKNITFANTTVSIKSAVTEQNEQQLDALAEELK